MENKKVLQLVDSIAHDKTTGLGKIYIMREHAAELSTNYNAFADYALVEFPDHEEIAHDAYEVQKTIVKLNKQLKKLQLTAGAALYHKMTMDSEAETIAKKIVIEDGMSLKDLNKIDGFIIEINGKTLPKE